LERSYAKVNKSVLTLVVPCYNEESGIAALAREIEKFGKFENVKIVIVENGSTDGTRKEIVKTFTESEKLFIVNIEENQGYGNGLKKGINIAQSEWIGWFHADLQVNIQSIISMIDQFNEAPSAMKGYRRKRSFVDWIFTQGMSAYCSMIFLTKLSDINGQPTIYRRSTLGGLEVAPDDFSFDLYCLLKAKWSKEPIRRISVDMHPRLSGESSWNNGFKARVKMSSRTILYSMKLRGAAKFK